MVKFVCNKAPSYSPTTLLRANSNTGASLYFPGNFLQFPEQLLSRTPILLVYSHLSTPLRDTLKREVQFRSVFYFLIFHCGFVQYIQYLLPFQIANPNYILLYVIRKKYSQSEMFCYLRNECIKRDYLNHSLRYFFQCELIPTLIGTICLTVRLLRYLLRQYLF